MKLRISGNSIRFRFSTLECDQLSESPALFDEVRFPAQSVLSYGVEGVEESEQEGAIFSDGVLKVRIHTVSLRRWMDGGELELERRFSLDSGGTLKVSLEKDLSEGHS